MSILAWVCVMVVGLEFCHSGLSGIFLYFQDGFPTSGNDILARPTTMTHTLVLFIKSVQRAALFCTQYAIVIPYGLAGLFVQSASPAVSAGWDLPRAWALLPGLPGLPSPGSVSSL